MGSRSSRWPFLALEEGAHLPASRDPFFACGDRELEHRGVPAVSAGDCLSPRSVEEAVLEGVVAASEL
jgi:hypothetical protein